VRQIKLAVCKLYRIVSYRVVNEGINAR